MDRAGRSRENAVRHARHPRQQCRVRQVRVDRGHDAGAMAVDHRRQSRQCFLRHQIYDRSEEHTSELQSLMRISYAVFCLKKKTKYIIINKISMINDNKVFMKTQIIQSNI